MHILNGNGADIAKHCIPAVPKKRYLIFFFELIFFMSSLYIMNFLIAYIIFYIYCSWLTGYKLHLEKLTKKTSIQIHSRSRAFASQPHR